MGSAQTIKVLPLIDFSDLKQGTPTWESVKIQVRKALEEYGCFEATFEQIPLHLRKSVLEAMQQVFDLPLENKLRNLTSKIHHGYIGQCSLVPLFESLGIEEVPGKVDTFTNLMWPQGNPAFSKSIVSFVEILQELDKTVRKMVLESLGLEKYVAEHMDSTNYLVRLQKYDAPRSHETQLGLTAHTDKNIVTTLYLNEVGGLEVQTKDGDWIYVQPSLNKFIVMTGEALRAWTNGRVRAAFHRVMMSGDKSRYSFALFTNLKPEIIVNAPDEMVDDEHPRLFKPFDNYKFVEFYTSEAGMAYPDALTAYCGV